MKYLIEKCDIPIIFVDTFALIDFYKYRKGIVNDHRISKLYLALREKVSQRKIICPIANQEEEINEHVSDIMKSFAPISLGIQFESSFEIQMSQLEQMIYAFKDNRDEFYLSYSDAFFDDVHEEIERKSDFIISVAIEPNDAEIQNRISTKLSNVEELQEFMDSDYNLRDYEKQLEEEFKGIYQATRYAIENINQKLIKGITPTPKDIEQYTNLFTIPYSYWDNCFGNKRGMNEYLNFLLTEHFRCIPYTDIYTRLITDIVSSKKSFESGDTQDISNISTYMPYCNYIITDRVVKNRVQRLGLDKKYYAELFSMNDIDLFISKLSSI